MPSIISTTQSREFHKRMRIRYDGTQISGCDYSPHEQPRFIVMGEGTTGLRASTLDAWYANRPAAARRADDSIKIIVNSVGIYHFLDRGEYGLEIAADYNTFGVVSIGPRDDVATRLGAANERRLHLIDKQFEDGLTPVENSELEKLQEEVSTIIDSQVPLPFGIIEELEAEIGQLD